ncbi:MAG: hypothetical protein EXR55_05560 [Dehalococcoidia bacterium]|nr:hypothetical protein [Dehalococcoidia bacterium]
MSKLIDKIEQAQQAAPRRLGFGPSTEQRHPPLPLLIGISGPAQGVPSSEMEKHLDAIVFQVNRPKGALGKKADPGRGPWGVWLDDPTAEAVRSLKEQGGDFVIFSPEGAPLQLLQEDDLAKILLVPLDWDQRMAPALHQLPVDGIAIALERDAPLTVQQLLAVSGLRRLAGKPLLLSLPHKPSQEELQVLRDSGVDCIMVDAASLGLQGVEEIRRRINALPRRQYRPEGRRLSALVPQMAIAPESRGEEEEEEEDD